MKKQDNLVESIILNTFANKLKKTLNDTSTWQHLEITPPKNQFKWLAEQTGLSQGFIYELMGGANISLLKAESIARALDTELWTLLRPEGGLTPNDGE